MILLSSGLLCHIGPSWLLLQLLHSDPLQRMHLLQLKKEINSVDSTCTGLHPEPVSSIDLFIYLLLL